MRTNVLRAAVVAVAACLAVFTSVEASAAVACQHASVGGAGFGQEAAVQSWQNKVAHTYGSAWSNFNLAKNKVWSGRNLDVTGWLSVSAIPCQLRAILPYPPLKPPY